MDERPARLTIGAGALAAGVAGAFVGFVDGARAAVLAGAGLGTLLATAGLVASIDAVLAGGAGAAAELVVRAAVWGRRARAPRWAQAAALLLAGVGAAGAACATVVATAQRNNRFLAAGLTTLAALAVSVAGVVLAPAAARLLAGRRARPAAATRPGPATILLAPLAAAATGAAIFWPISQTRLLAGPALAASIRLTVAVAVIVPAALAGAAAVRLPIRWRPAALIAAVVFGGAIAFAIARAWDDNLRFAPWSEIVTGAAIAAVALVLAWAGRGRISAQPLQIALGAMSLWLAAAAVVMALSPLDAPRKIATAHSAFVTQVLDAGRRWLDFDGDGYARALGGGDCDDRDALVHPGALDIPGDGVDTDCDGEDATDALPPPARMADVPAAVPPDLDLLLVTIDTLRADHLGCYGYARPTSPAIDALAAEGALFENGWAHAPSTRYSMPAIASGRWPSAITWDESIWWPRLGPDVRTTAQALHDAGYFTGGLFSFNYFALADHRGFERGMDEYHAERAALHVAVNGPMESRGSSSREITDDAIAFVSAHKDKKFFLWIHYYDPHLSYETHAEVPSFGTSRVDRYDGEIRFTDLHLQRLIAHLRAIGLWDRTAVIVTGDHGEGFGEHGVTEHGFDLYAAQTKVPFIVRVPGLTPRRVRVPVGHVDIAPTLVNLARGAAEPSFIGRSLLPDVAGPPAADTDSRAVFQEVTSERGKKRALTTTSRHLIWNAMPSDTTECYDRTRDPAEEHDTWEGPRSGSDGSCAGLSRSLKRLVSGLALPSGAADKVRLAVTPPGAASPPPGQPLQAALGDAILVRGYDASSTTIAAGGVLELTTHFAAGAPLPAGWRLFFHLEGPSGYRNLDHVPVEGLMPLERWRRGQGIRDRLRVPIPPGTPPGAYTVYVGAYRGAQRLPVTPPALADGNNRLRLFSFTVTPATVGSAPRVPPPAKGLGPRGPAR
jgi:arylsulfatase A-like enzyme